MAIGNYSVDPEDVLRFQIKRINTAQFKAFLVLLNEIAQDHDVALQKLQDALPDEYKVYVDLADHLTPEKADALRKKVLDAGNDSYRNMEEILKTFNIGFK